MSQMTQSNLAKLIDLNFGTPLFVCRFVGVYDRFYREIPGQMIQELARYAHVRALLGVFQNRGAICTAANILAEGILEYVELKEVRLLLDRSTLAAIEDEHAPWRKLEGKVGQPLFGVRVTVSTPPYITLLKHTN